MQGLRLLLTMCLLALVIAAQGSHRRIRQAATRIFLFTKSSFDIIYKPGGLRASQVISLKKGKQCCEVAALPGGYFDPPTCLNVDLTVTSNGKRVGYLTHLRRPVLAIGKHFARIVWPTKSGAILLRKGECALAGDKRAISPKKCLLRHLIAVTKTAMISILYRGGDAACRCRMRQLGYSNFLFMDGDTTLLTGKKVPSWIVVTPV